MRPFVRVTSRALRPSVRNPQTLQRPFVRAQRPDTTWAQVHEQQRVRLRQPWLTWRRAGLWMFYATVSYAAGQYLLDKLFDGWELEEEEEQDADQATTADEEDGVDDGDGDDDESEAFLIPVGEDSPTFLPLQTPKQLPRQYYRKSDPEWQEFLKLNRNTDRQAAVRRELAEKLTRSASALKPLRQKLGKDIRWTKLWLDFTYPDQSAPEYIRRGWALVEEGSLWSKQIIPHSHYVQIHHILWPTALFTAAKASLRMFYDLQVIKMKDAAGIELQQREKQIQLATRVVRMQLQAKAKLDRAKTQMEQTKAQIDEPPELQQQMRKLNAEKIGPPDQKVDSRDDTSQNKFRSVGVGLPTPTISVDLTIASRTFIGILAQAWRASKLDTMPAGCCYLSGDVELVGSQGRCKMGVLAAYNPETNSFVWINSKPRGFWLNSQNAKGGP